MQPIDRTGLGTLPNICTCLPPCSVHGMRPPITQLFGVYSQVAQQAQASQDSSANNFTSSPAKSPASTPSSFEEVLKTLNSLISGLWDMSWPNVVLSGTGLKKSQRSSIVEDLQHLSAAATLMQQVISKITLAASMMSSSQTNSLPSPETGCSNCSHEHEPPMR